MINNVAPIRLYAETLQDALDKITATRSRNRAGAKFAVPLCFEDNPFNVPADRRAVIAKVNEAQARMEADIKRLLDTPGDE